jgi:hypothetical protein
MPYFRCESSLNYVVHNTNLFNIFRKKPFLNQHTLFFYIVQRVCC